MFLSASDLGMGQEPSAIAPPAVGVKAMAVRPTDLPGLAPGNVWSPTGVTKEARGQTYRQYVVQKASDVGVTPPAQVPPPPYVPPGEIDKYVTHEAVIGPNYTLYGIITGAVLLVGAGLYFALRRSGA